MDNLKDMVKQAVFGYAGGGSNLKTFRMSDEENQVYGVTIIDYPIHRRDAGILVMARIDGDQVIIEEDTTDKPLLDALIQAGVPREKIVLAYAGEAVPSE